jgi:hypothetical protein
MKECEDRGAAMIQKNNSPSHDRLKISPQPLPNNDNINQGILVMGVNLPTIQVGYSPRYLSYKTLQIVRPWPMDCLEPCLSSTTVPKKTVHKINPQQLQPMRVS